MIETVWGTAAILLAADCADIIAVVDNDVVILPLVVEDGIIVELDIGCFFGGVLVAVVDEDELLESSESESESPSSELLSSVPSELSSSSDVVDNGDRLFDEDDDCGCLRLFPLVGIIADVDCNEIVAERSGIFVAPDDDVDRFLFEMFTAFTTGDDSLSSSSDESFDEPELEEPLDDDPDEEDEADDDDDDADNVRFLGICNDSFGHTGDVNIDFVNDDDCFDKSEVLLVKFTLVVE